MSKHPSAQPAITEAVSSFSERHHKYILLYLIRLMLKAYALLLSAPKVQPDPLESMHIAGEDSVPPLNLPPMTFVIH